MLLPATFATVTIAEQQKIFREKLEPVYGHGEANAITGLVLEEVLELNRMQLSLERFRLLTVGQQQQLQTILNRLLQNEPVQYVLGVADFCGIKLNVSPAVLIPRAETEELVYWVEAVLEKEDKTDISLLDIGTGSGCIAVTIGKLLPWLKVHAVDVSAEALQVADSNCTKFDCPVQLRQMDILMEQLPTGAYTAIVSNPPYILPEEAEQMHNNVLKYEPHLALFAPGTDGLIFYRVIAQQAKNALKPGGYLFFEINAAKGAEVVEILENEGFTGVTLRNDLSGKPRMVMGGL